jgi:hypothetical protein
MLVEFSAAERKTEMSQTTVNVNKQHLGIIGGLMVIIMAAAVVFITVKDQDHKEAMAKVIADTSKLDAALREKFEKAKPAAAYKKVSTMEGIVDIGHQDARMEHNSCSTLPIAGRWKGQRSNIRRLQLSGALVKGYNGAVGVEVYEKCSGLESKLCYPTMQIIYYSAPVNGNWTYSSQMRDHMLMTACHHDGGVTMIPKHITN